MGGSGSTTTETKGKTQTVNPYWMNRASRSAVDTAMGRMRQPYEAYGGQRIADLSASEQMGITKAQQDAELGAQDFASARGALEGIGSFTDEGVAEQYMNPYLEQVMRPGLRRKNEAFEAERARRKQTRGMTGAFGGRGNIEDIEFERSFQESQDEYMGGMRGAAYSEAGALYGTEQDRKISQAGAYTNLATGRAAEGRSRIYDLMNSGLVERTRDQADLDFQYIEAIEERDWDINNLSTLVQTLGSIPYEQETRTETTQTTFEEPDDMQMIAGVAMIAAGVMTGGAALGPMMGQGLGMMTGQ